MKKKVVSPSWLNEARISSLEKKPANGGRPAKATVPIIKVVKVFGITFLNPPISSMLLLWTA